jgi:hypothetical protein
MKVVSYSLSASGSQRDEHYRRELFYSVKSLRRFNRNVRVVVFLYDEHPVEFIGSLEKEAVEIRRCGAYRDAVASIRPRAYRTFQQYPCVHKWLNYVELAPLAPTQVLQVDCDTLFFDDVENLFSAYSEQKVYAREEPRSRACPYGYEPSCLDEDQLAAVARSEGAASVGPYNLGVCLLNHGAWAEIAQWSPVYLEYVFRFNAWLSRNPATREKLPLRSRDLLAEDLSEAPEVADLLFPSPNLWIMDQVALWLTLGRIPGLTHGPLSVEHVRQGPQEARGARSGVVFHYFGIDKSRFVARIPELLV